MVFFSRFARRQICLDAKSAFKPTSPLFLSVYCVKRETSYRNYFFGTDSSNREDVAFFNCGNPSKIQRLMFMNS